MDVHRFVVIVLDSVGIGELPDAAEYGDVGSHTLGNIARVNGGLGLPHMEALGLGNIAILQGIVPQASPAAVYGKMAEMSAGKDTTTGHWELMGIHLRQPFPTYPDGFPREVMDAFEAEIGGGTLGNYPASGTVIIETLGAIHMETGQPIVYTSGDSVFQIAAHEDVIPVEQLYEMCRQARRILKGEHEVSRVIARPFEGESGRFVRTDRRRDFSVRPPAPTVLDNLKAVGMMVYAIGKIEDIFDGQGITGAVHTHDNQHGIDETIAALRERQEKGLIFTNLVDFDAKYGHRNYPAGYAEALTAFDERLPEITEAMSDSDVLVITADHGNDPTTPSTDHSREYVPLLITGRSVWPGVNLGVRETFADLGATIAHLLGVTPPAAGTSFGSLIMTTPENATSDQLLALIQRDPAQIARLIDHTLLRPDATEMDIERLCREAREYGFASVCVNPTHVRFAANALKGSPVKTCAVIGFPLGATTTQEKVIETENAIKRGASEVDMVINIGALKGKAYDFVKEQIEAVVRTAHNHKALCKVIIETSYLTNEEKRLVCRFAADAGADFVKTSTGFSGGGATVEDVKLMRLTVGMGVGVKAAGGIRSFADAKKMIAAGANRIGASNGVGIVREALSSK